MLFRMGLFWIIAELQCWLDPLLYLLQYNVVWCFTLLSVSSPKLRTVMPTWPWSHPRCSLAAAHRRYSILTSCKRRNRHSPRGRMNPAQTAPPPCLTCTLLCKRNASKQSTLQLTERVTPTTFERSFTLWCWNPTLPAAFVQIDDPPQDGAAVLSQRPKTTNACHAWRNCALKEQNQCRRGGRLCCSDDSVRTKHAIVYLHKWRWK